jgi:signal transduction histidine kinase
VPTDPRRASRPADRRIVSGVSAGLADHLGVDALWVRLAFTIGAVLNGAGIVAYLLMWRFLPLAEPQRSPGLEAATRRGMRTSGPASVVEVVRAVAVLALGAGLGLALQVSGRGIGWGLFVPLVVGGVGLGVIWRGLDDSRSGGVSRRGRLRTIARVVVGVALIVAAAVYLVTAERGWAALADIGAFLVVALVGVALILGPWIASLVGDLSAERRERVRSQERADVAAHLHDSVLQTLALLQKNAADPALVATLARRQERDLRSWLYGDEQATGDTVAAAVRAVAAEVETDHRVAVEVIAVGDAPLDDDRAAVVRAAREAMVNAAKHAHVDRIDVYAESADGGLEIFVRDRGVGFDPASVAEDRMGLRGSIVGRVERHGGTVDVRSAPGEGTEIRLALAPHRAATPHEDPR